MNNLNLPNPKMMDVAVPANMQVGLAQDEIARRGWAVTADEAHGAGRRGPTWRFIDLRETTEREKHGVIPGSLHAPYPDLHANIAPGGMLHALAAATGKRLVFYCAFGERSAMAVQAAQDARLASACHIQGGIDAWKKADGPLDAHEGEAKGRPHHRRGAWHRPRDRAATARRWLAGRRGRSRRPPISNACSASSCAALP